jgi:eukaryotic-like serine/threonine-protein kinase
VAQEHSPNVRHDSLTPPDSSEAATPARDPSDQALQRGDQLKHYIVLERLGSGGQGVVYAAYDPLVDRKVALKLLRSDVSQGEGQLRKEAQTLGKLDHPNVVTVHSVEDDGKKFLARPFITMQFKSGGTLAEWAKKPRALDEVLARFREAGAGLAAAHRVGVVHRDFKPDNVLLDEHGVACVTDFGLARELEHASAGGAGTRRYMAPEQRERGAVSPFADQYSFCVALFQVLTGSWPFEESSSPLLRFPPGDTTPQWVRDVIARGLSLDPAHRYPSMDALLQDLSSDPRTQRRRLLRTAAVIALVAGVATAVGAFAFSESPAQRAERECVERVAQIRTGLWSGSRVQQMQNAFATAAGDLGSQTFERVRARMEPEVEAWARQSTRTCRLADPVQRRVLFGCLEARGQTLVSLSDLFAHADRPVVESAVHTLGLEMQPVTSCQAGVATLPQLEDSEVDARLRPTLARARVLHAAGRLGEGKEAALAVAGAAEQEGARRVASEAALLVGQLSAELGEVGAEDRLKRAISAADAVGADEERAQGWMALVVYYADRSEFPAALSAEAQAEAIVQRLGSPELLEAELFNQRGRRLTSQGDPDGAEEAFEHARALLLKHRPEDDALVMRAQNNYLGSLEPEDALEGFRALAVLRERVLGPTHPETALTHHNIGAVLLKLERCPEADVEVGLALASRLSAGEPSPLRLGAEHKLRAQVLACLKRPEDAIAEERAAVDLLRRGGERDATMRLELNFLHELLAQANHPPAELEDVERQLKLLTD